MAAIGLTIITKAPMNDDVLCCAAAHDASIEVDPTRNRMVLVLCFLHAFVQDERERERERDEYQRKTITCTWCLCNNRQVALALSARHAIIIIIIIGDDQADLPPIEHTVLCRTVLYCINKSPTSVQRRAVLGPVPRCLFIPTAESALPPFQGHESGSK